MLRRLISCRIIIIIIIIINTIRAAKTDKRHSMSCVTAVQGINRKPQPIMRLPISLRLYHFRDIVSTSHLHFLLTRETKYRTCVIRGHWSKICIFSPFFFAHPISLVWSSRKEVPLSPVVWTTLVYQKKTESLGHLGVKTRIAWSYGHKFWRITSVWWTDRHTNRGTRRLRLKVAF